MLIKPLQRNRYLSLLLLLTTPSPPARRATTCPAGLRGWCTRSPVGLVQLSTVSLPSCKSTSVYGLELDANCENSFNEWLIYRTTTELTTSFADNISSLLHLGDGNHVVEYLIRAVCKLNHTTCSYPLPRCTSRRSFPLFGDVSQDKPKPLTARYVPQPVSCGSEQILPPPV